MGDEAFGIVFPAPIDVLLDAWIVYLLPKQVEQVVLPFSVHHVIGNEAHVFPFSLGGESARRDEDVEMRIELPRAAKSLQHHHTSDVQWFAGGNTEDVFEAGKHLTLL